MPLVVVALAAGGLWLVAGRFDGSAVQADRPAEPESTASTAPVSEPEREPEDAVEPEPGDTTEPDPDDLAEPDDVADGAPSDGSIADVIDRWAGALWGEYPPAPDVAAIAAFVEAMDRHGPDCSWQAESVVGDEQWTYCRIGDHWEQVGFRTTTLRDPDDPGEGERFVSESFTLFGGELIGAYESDVGYSSWNVPYYLIGDTPVLGPSLGHGKTERDEWDPAEIFDQWANRREAYDALRSDAVAVDGTDDWQGEPASERMADLLAAFTAAGGDWPDDERPSVYVVAYAAIVDSFVEGPTCVRTVQEMIGDEAWTYCRTSPTLELVTIETASTSETYVVQAGELIGLIEQNASGWSASSYVAGCSIVAVRSSGNDEQPGDAIERWNDRKQWFDVAREE